MLSAAVFHPAAALGFLLAGLGLRLAGATGPADLLWTAGLYVTGLPVVWRTLRGAVRGRFAADLVASLAILGAILLDQALAGLVVTLMQTGGEALERAAARRASRAVAELESLAPQVVHLRRDSEVEDVPVGRVAPGDRLLVRPGEMVPCDGTVEDGAAAVDVSRLTGEPVPLAARPGTRLRSGGLVLDGPLTIRATATAGESLYARIVDLVRSAEASKAPLQRMADRVAVWFTPATLAVCAVAWGASGDPHRVLAVLVVATPCPLILAVPVAMIGGLNRAARRRIIIRDGGALEALALVDCLVVDKTGTVTLGQPEVERVEAVNGFGPDQVLRLAAAVDRDAGHPLARSLVRSAMTAGAELPEARDVRESAGRGVTGVVEGRRITVGSLGLLREREAAAAERFGAASARDGLHAWVAVDGKAAGVISFADRPRTGVPEALRELEALGLRRQVMLSGDAAAAVRAVAGAVGLHEVEGDLLPAEKVDRVRGLEAGNHRVLMVGDGINDAPALATASVGMALAAHGGGIAAESADVVLLEDDFGRIPEAVRIGRSTMRIARQSVGAGVLLSGSAMVIAALGYIPPTMGALLQEAIDVAVILNATRAAR